MKTQVRVKCASGKAFCLRQFTIRVDSKYEGKAIQVECPGCFNKLKVGIPISVPDQEEGSILDEVLGTVEEKIDDVMTSLENIDIGEVFDGLVEKIKK